MTEHHQPAPLLGPSPEALELLLDEGSPFTPPSRILSGLSAQEACRAVAGQPHTIAEIVAHLHFWQTYTLALARGELAAPPTHAAEGWPAAPPDDWERLRRAFLAGWPKPNAWRGRQIYRAWCGDATPSATN